MDACGNKGQGPRDDKQPEGGGKFVLRIAAEVVQSKGEREQTPQASEDTSPQGNFGMFNILMVKMGELRQPGNTNKEQGNNGRGAHAVELGAIMKRGRSKGLGKLSVVIRNGLAVLMNETAFVELSVDLAVIEHSVEISLTVSRTSSPANARLGGGLFSRVGNESIIAGELGGRNGQNEENQSESRQQVTYKFATDLGE